MLRPSVVKLINKYQRYIRPGLPVCCRFSPTCSEYAKQALVKYGFFKGGIKAIRRLLTCQPFSAKFGHDPLL